MPSPVGRTRRPNGTTSVRFTMRVNEEAHEKAARAAAALGLTMAAYFEHLLRREELDESGRPLWWSQHQEELPLSQSA
ncbi:toxin-antitoxin system HicB family antitoxin [Kineococcus auxinigenes]|uniref:toxin-antitoxin system HicB family antitoxin n=1 Tax=unclassified Kineococcus TaxID=2621656 RepID=UPI003D7DB245